MPHKMTSLAGSDEKYILMQARIEGPDDSVHIHIQILSDTHATDAPHATRRKYGHAITISNSLLASILRGFEAKDD